MSVKAAILDSDFTIKSALTKNSQDKSLADVVLELPYKFYCHEQNKIEVTDHTKIESAWLLMMDIWYIKVKFHNFWKSVIKS